MKFSKILIPLLLVICTHVHAQHYTAIHGSSYFGSLSVYNNPSSIVSCPYKWDLTLLGLQFQTVTNSIRGKNFPFYLLPGPAFSVAEGNYARKAYVNYNIHLFNARYSIDKNHAFAFGLNFRDYGQATTGKVDYTDSVKGPTSFLSLNDKNRIINVNMASSAWMELYGSYGFNIFDREANKLNAGVTFKILRGMSGAFAQVNNVKVDRSQVNDSSQTIYTISNGSAQYGYSANHTDATRFNAADLFTNSKTSFAVDLGVEYTIKTEAVTSVFDENAETDYEWKIGVSLLDLGWNQFHYGSQSRKAATLKQDVSSTVLQTKFASVKTVPQFNDSLATIVDQLQPLTGDFTIMNPARAVVNVDRYVSGNWYVNGELSINLSGSGKNKVSVRETNLLTVTPRWETRRLGVYIPVQYLSTGGFWIGGAIKAGPLLLGTHNLLNTFSKKKYLSGGAYLAIILRPMNFIRDARTKQYDCPKY